MVTGGGCLIPIVVGIGFLALAAVATMSGCARHGHYFDITRVDSFQPGMTTVGEAYEALGEPVSRSTQANGNYLLQWQYVEGTPFGGSAGHVALLFGPDNVLIRVIHRYKT